MSMVTFSLLVQVVAVILGRSARRPENLLQEMLGASPSMTMRRDLSKPLQYDLGIPSTCSAR